MKQFNSVRAAGALSAMAASQLAFQPEAAAQAPAAVQLGGQGNWYQLVSNPAGPTHWPFDSARTAALAQGAHLLTFASVAEAEQLHALLQVQGVIESSAVWVGLYQDRSAPDYVEPNGGWRWVDGTTLTFNPWLGSEPTNACGGQQFIPQDWGAWVRLSTLSGRIDDLGNPAPTCPDQIWIAAFEWSADCDSDGIVDYGQILRGERPDANANGVPDGCECFADLNSDGYVQGADLGLVLAAWGAAPAGTAADINRDGAVDGTDLGLLLATWGACGG